MFEIQKSGNKTSSGEIGLDIRTHASPKVGQDQVSGGIKTYCMLNFSFSVFLGCFLGGKRYKQSLKPKFCKNIKKPTEKVALSDRHFRAI